jgi:hypothetical protein
MKKLLVVAMVSAFLFVNMAVIAQDKPVEKKDTKKVTQVAKADKKADKKTAKKSAKKEDCANCKDGKSCDTEKAAKKEAKADTEKKEVKKGGPSAEKSCCDKK